MKAIRKKYVSMQEKVSMIALFFTFICKFFLLFFIQVKSSSVNVLQTVNLKTKFFRLKLEM